METYNPLFNNEYGNLIELENFEVMVKFKLSNLNEWQCPVCYETLKNDDTIINFPFKCNHLTCYNCFKKNCVVLKRSNKCPMRHLKCPLCRADPNDDWMKKDRLKMKKINYEGYDLKFYDTN